MKASNTIHRNLGLQQAVHTTCTYRQEFMSVNDLGEWIGIHQALFHLPLSSRALVSDHAVVEHQASFFDCRLEEQIFSNFDLQYIIL